MAVEMNCADILKQLEAWGAEKARAINARHGAGENQFGVNLSLLRDLAKQLKRNHPLALELWATGNVEAMLLAAMIMDPKQFSRDDLDRMMHEVYYFKITDWFVLNVVKNSKIKEDLRVDWMNSPEDQVGRAGWSLTIEKVTKGKGEGLDLDALLKQIEAEMADAPLRKQETMNFCLIEIALNNPDLVQRCIDIGTKLKVLIDYPVPKGCISPYAPIAIEAMLARKNQG